MVKKVTVLVVLLILLLPVLERLLRYRPKLLTAIRRGMLAVYLGAYVHETLLFRRIRPESLVNLDLMSSWRKAFSMPDGIMSLFLGTATVASPSMKRQVLLNLLLCVPLGYLLPAVFPRIRNWQVIAVCTVLSVLTEVLQLTFRIGWCEFDDIIYNLVGCLAGLLMHRLIFRRQGKSAADNDVQERCE